MNREHPDSGHIITSGESCYSAADMATAAAQGFRDGVASCAGEAVAWPKDAAEVRAFIGSQFERLQYGQENGVPHENDRYTLTSHDLLSAFRWRSENLPSPPEGMAGWKLVPIEPTPAMLAAVVTTMDDFLLGKEAEKQYREDWAAMLDAAPHLPASEAKDLT